MTCIFSRVPEFQSWADFSSTSKLGLLISTTEFTAQEVLKEALEVIQEGRAKTVATGKRNMTS